MAPVSPKRNQGLLSFPAGASVAPAAVGSVATNTAAANDGLPAAHQIQAVRSLAKISARNPDNAEVQKLIKSHLETISAEKKGTGNLQKELDNVLKGLD